MIEKKEILIGTVDELIEHLMELSKSYTETLYAQQSGLKNGMFMFNSKEGFKEQLEHIIKNNKGIGPVFYLHLDDSPYKLSKEPPYKYELREEGDIKEINCKLDIIYVKVPTPSTFHKMC